MKKRDDAAKWLEALQVSLVESGVDEVPEGWDTMDEISQKINLSLSHTRHLVLELCKAGKAERKIFRITGGKRRTCPVPHYRLL